ncbi:hypothetical protein [Streptomyces buecherae]|uniref:Uncharacterized protein n=1 Tax=Streptomyces buecherae TaxID=2763006 RepID=A0A7H8NHX0_9ACTN|nr:hypothetical protein [Streptomyces buecherae]QKW48206.1 hypothetical protein HUT08_00065 [Streptomyces buecherae]QKW54124.1 hypothetical protein HUT08_36360 [Streptomyces buecherae]
MAFQKAPEHSVDDLVIHAARADEPEPSLVLAIAVRRAPDLVQSNESSAKLICTFVQEVLNAPTDGPDHRAALVVAGPQEHAEQLAVLAAEAVTQKDAPNFFGLLRTHRKFPAGVRTRLTHIEELVKLALATLGTADPSTQLVEQRTWELLSRLTVLMPRLETPDELDWARVTNSLIPVARGMDLYGATRLLERLVALADEYPPKAATVDLSFLRRDAHQVLDSATRHRRQGWRALSHLHERALASVRDEIATEDSRMVHLDRSDTASQLLQLVESPAAAVVAHGDSGVGKSALVVRTLTDAAQDLDSTQVACINLRHLPPTTVELESVLGTSLNALLGELSAPRRLLVIDGADALAEGMLDLFLYLIDTAGQADVKVVAVTANDAQQVVRDTINERCVGEVAGFEVPLLTDAQVAEIVAVFDELSALAEDSRSRELLRRPVVVDLLVRGGVKTTPLSDADAMQQVWSGLVLRQRPERGTPDARNIALLRLAALELGQGDPLEVVGAIDPIALAGLRQDGVLRTHTDDPFAIGPQFAHDEVRRYAIARLFLSAGHPTEKLVEAGVPRWALGAARLACQALLAVPDTHKAPLRGRFARLQQAFDDLVAAGHGDRWGDVPGEALLTLGAPDPVLREAWPTLRAEPGTGLRRLIRLVHQRLHNEAGLVRIAAAEPLIALLIALLLDDDEPWRQGKHVQDMLRDWLHAAIIADTPAGYPLRGRLHDRLLAACDAADRRLNDEQAAAAAAKAAPSPEEAEAERQYLERRRLLSMGDTRQRERVRRRLELPREITDELMVELLALLGPDLGEDGEAVLRRVARDAPAWAGPAVEEVLTGRALAMYRRGFLAELTEAYYINEDQDGARLHQYGIRRHSARRLGVGSLAAWYRGPFMPLFRSDFRNGVSVLNRMLNHAALARARTLAGGHRHDSVRIDDHDLDAYRINLDVDGARRTYVGDEHVWLWYRGTGVGPYPCMSALQALEQMCDQLVEADVPLAALVAILLEDCENLAMVALVVGLLVRLCRPPRCGDQGPRPGSDGVDLRLGHRPRTPCGTPRGAPPLVACCRTRHGQSRHPRPDRGAGTAYGGKHGRGRTRLPAPRRLCRRRDAPGKFPVRAVFRGRGVGGQGSHRTADVADGCRPCDRAAGLRAHALRRAERLPLRPGFAPAQPCPRNRIPLPGTSGRAHRLVGSAGLAGHCRPLVVHRSGPRRMRGSAHRLHQAPTGRGPGARRPSVGGEPCPRRSQPCREPHLSTHVMAD